MVTIIEVDEKLIDIVSGAVCVRLKNYGQPVNESHEQGIREIVTTFEKAKDASEPIVISALCGIGKSIIIDEYVAYKCNRNKDFGALIVKERIEQCEESERTINAAERFPADFGASTTQDFAYTIKGFSKNNCYLKHSVYHPLMCTDQFCDEAGCEVKLNFIYQKRHPTVLISHKRLFQSSETNSVLKELGTFESHSRICPRQLIIIDERPNIVDINTFYQENIDEFKDLCEKVDALKNEAARALYLLFIANRRIEKNITFIDPVDPKFKFSEHFILDWVLKYKGNNYGTPGLIEKLIKNGGYASANYKNGKRKYTVYQINTLDFPGFKTVILDGTASLDQTYHNRNILLKTIQLNKTYKNLQLNIYRARLSKSYLSTNLDQKIDCITKDIKEIIRDSAGKVFVNCYKTVTAEEEENEEEKSFPFEEMVGDKLEKEIKRDKVIISHFGGNKGSNQMNDCTTMVSLGLLNKGPDYYFVKSHAIGLPSSKVEDNEQTVELIQDFYRCKMRDFYYDGFINIYLITKSRGIISTLKDYFSGCTITDWTPANLCYQQLTEKTYRKTTSKKAAILKYLIEELVQPGQEISKAKIYKEFDTRSDYVKDLCTKEANLDFQQELERRGIKYKGKKFQKVN